MASYQQNNIDCSIVIPLYNEEPVIDQLYDRLTSTMVRTALAYEIVFVDDGSTDRTLELIKSIAEKDPKVVVVELCRNFGQTAALAAGFDTSTGQIIISMDGDLQHSPEEIPDFLEKLNQGYDVVSGWRKHRTDNLLTRKIPSRVANWLASKISGVDIHDFGTTFKAYRRQMIASVNLYGEMHRFIPAMLSWSGAKIVEIPITSIARAEGTSHYGISRTFRVLFDLITLRFLLGYATRPLHFFGKIAIYCIITAALMDTYILYDKFVYNVPVMLAHGPMAGLAAVLLLVGLILISTGLIGELISRVYFESTNRKIYSVRKIYHRQS
jgi:glycosyltransferase involved in cell wall biosynthesis